MGCYMKFDLKDLNPGAWFDIVDGKPEEGRICLRVANDATLKAIKKQSVKPCVEYKHGQRFEFNKVDEDLSSALLWDYCIVSWESIQDPDGKDIPCDRDSKFILMTGSRQFAKIIGECLKKLAEDEAKAAQEEEKN